MEQYCVYNNPPEWPGWYVVRRFKIGPGSVVRDEDWIFMCRSLEDIRDELSMRALTCVTRSRDDNPVIVETWL